MDSWQLRLSGLDKPKPAIEEGTGHARAEVLNKVKCSRGIVQHRVYEYFEVSKFQRPTFSLIEVIQRSDYDIL